MKTIERVHLFVLLGLFVFSVKIQAQEWKTTNHSQVCKILTPKKTVHHCMAVMLNYDSAKRKAVFSSAQHCNLDFLSPTSEIVPGTAVICPNPKTKAPVYFEVEQINHTSFTSYHNYHYVAPTLAERVGLSSVPHRPIMNQGFYHLRSDDVTLFTAKRVSGKYQKSYWPFQIVVPTHSGQLGQFFEEGNRINNETYHEESKWNRDFKFLHKNGKEYKVYLHMNHYISYRFIPQNTCYIFSNDENPDPGLNQKYREMTSIEKENTYLITGKDIRGTSLQNLEKASIGMIDPEGGQSQYRGDSGSALCCLNNENPKECLLLGSSSSIEAMKNKYTFNGSFWTFIGNRYIRKIRQSISDL